MRLGIVSDIHCNIEALDQAVERMGPIDELLCAGDACYQFRFSNAVAKRLRALGAKYVLGNHEDILLSPDGIRAQQSDKVNQDLLEWTRGIPHYIRTQVNGKRLLMFHSTPWPPYKDYLYPSSPELERLSQEDADYIIYGHTHYQLQRRIGRALVINPGSTGEPRDPSNAFQLSCVVLDTQTDEVIFYNYPDPTRIVAPDSSLST